MAILVTEGKEWIIDKVQDLAPLSNAKMNVILSGTGATAEAAGNTIATFTEVSEARVTGTLSQPTAQTDRLVGTVSYTGSKNVTETGRCNTTTKGDANQKLLMRALFTAVPVENGDSIEFTLDHTQ
jgi:hypothetical protein